MELNASGNVNFDFGRYGVEFTASPRHADGVVITGPITENMAVPLELCYNAVPEPKIVVLVGADAISGGIYAGSPALDRSFLERHRVDLFVPGNPAHPLTYIDGVMNLVGKKRGKKMRVLIQRVSEASVRIDGKVCARIGTGMLVLVGIEEADTREDADWLCKKLLNLRIFPDERQVMNRSLTEVGGEVLIVSQFTLHASTKKGNRPSYIRAAKPEQAVPLYEYFVNTVETELGRPVGTGVFGADMSVALVNDGPVTIWIDSKNRE